MQFISQKDFVSHSFVQKVPLSQGLVSFVSLCLPVTCTIQSEGLPSHIPQSRGGGGVLHVVYYYYFFLRDFIFKKTLFEKLYLFILLFIPTPTHGCSQYIVMIVL